MATSKPQTKSAKVIALLNRAEGASIDEICKVTNWKPHSVRAFLTGLRKKDFAVVREQYGDGKTAHRIAKQPTNKQKATKA